MEQMERRAALERERDRLAALSNPLEQDGAAAWDAAGPTTEDEVVPG